MNLYAQEAKKNHYNFGGLAFGDFYYVADNHLEENVGDTGIVLRRAYLTFNAKIHKKWFGRFRLEVNQSGEFETYSFQTSIKDFYVGYKAGKHEIIAGLSPTKTFDLIENIWGLRYLTRTPLDLQGIASRDLGVSIQGPIDTHKSFSYRFMFGKGFESIDVDDVGMKWQGAISWNHLKKWFIDFYLDYEKLDGASDRSTIQLFVGYKDEKLRWGLQYANQYRQQDPRLELVSAFITGKVYNNIALIGRVDRLLEPSPRGNAIYYIPFDPNSKATFFVGGIEFPISTHFMITPNVVYTTYDESNEGIKPTNDLQYRLSLFLNFEK